MECFEYENDEVVNKYNCNFFHMSLKGFAPFDNHMYDICDKDYASFIHEYIHFIQQITTPYGLKYSEYFYNNYILFRDYINENQEINIPVNIDEVDEPAVKLEKVLGDRNGSRSFNKGLVDAVNIDKGDIENAKLNRKAVDVSVYDFELDRIYEKELKFGYWCIIESMSHMIQSLVNPILHHKRVPYEAVQIICKEVYPDICNDIKLLISICYISLHFDNPGAHFFEVLEYVRINQQFDGQVLFKAFMIDFSRTIGGVNMPTYRMVHKMMDGFIKKIEDLIGNESKYYKQVFKNCKIEIAQGESILLKVLYEKDINKKEDFDLLVNFYGYPCIDSASEEVIIPFDDEGKPYIETASLLSLEMILYRIKNNEQKCQRFPICNARPRETNTTDENCLAKQWNHNEQCLFTCGLMYWGWSEKDFIIDVHD